jgi:hypothetical protein
MDYYDIKRLALILAIQAEIEGMKAFNKEREINGASLGYTEADFGSMADQFRDLANKHNEQL